MSVYYNDNEAYCCQWIRNLIEAGELPNGNVDERDIRDIAPHDLRSYLQVHLFAGVGGWPYALRLAGWPEDQEVWTGSCPCQPFSTAGKGKGVDDPRHLWPAFRWLIAQCRPATVFGEQVSSPAGRRWLSGVRADLEALGYAVGAADLCAAGIGAPHIRQRLFWVAESAECGQRRRTGACGQDGTKTADSRRLGDAQCGPAERQRRNLEGAPSQTQDEAWQRKWVWSDAWTTSEFVPCADGKARRIEPGTSPLAYGIPAKLGPELAGLGRVAIRAARANRIGRLRGYGNAIVPQLAAEFVRCFMETVPDDLTPEAGK